MKRSQPSVRGTRRVPAARSIAEEQAFSEVAEMIQAARRQALGAVDTALIELYWRIGEAISRRIHKDGWGKATVTSLAAYIQIRHPGMRGFSPQNLWRMRQFFETYCDQPELSALLRELPWSANLHMPTSSYLLGSA